MSTLNLNQLVRDAHEQNNYDPLLSLMPYAKLLGIECLRLGDDMVFRLPANKDCIGNPTLPALHGGVIAGFMEHAAMLHLLIFMGIPHLPKIIDFSIDYLRAGLYRDTFVKCQVWRQGRRVANVAITAWQTSQTEPIATARAHFKVDEP
jgi:acyl-coenzyme A thioesterase PaaI-like protein